MSSTVTLKASGLVTSPNQLDVPNGALTEAANIIIKRDGVIEPRRGFKLHGTPLSDPSFRVKQLKVYRDRILRHYNNSLQYDSTGTGTFVDFAESFTEAVTGVRFKSTESNGNMYLTSDKGIKKISTNNSAGLSTAVIEPSGGIKAVDLTSEVQYTYKNQSGFMPQNSTIAYRALWNINDINGNLIQGTPSQRSIVTNSTEELLIQDFNRLLLALDEIYDNSAGLERLSDLDYSSTLGLDSTASAVDIRQAAVNLTAKLDLDIEYGNISSTAAIDLLAADTLVVTGGLATYTRTSGTGAIFTDYLSSGSKITLSGMSNTNAILLNGDHIVSSVTSTTIVFATTETAFVSETVNGSPVLNTNEYGSIITPTVASTPATNDQLLQVQIYISDIISRLQLESDGTGTLAGIVIDPTNKSTFIDPIDVTTSSTVKLKVTIPEGITTNHFLQLYRSAASQAVGVEILSDKSPSDELKLVYEGYVTDGTVDPTNDNLADGYIEVLDETPSSFRGANLYTNPSTGEGITQANDIPPYAKDINRFRNVVFYANTKTRHRFFLNILGVEDLVAEANNSLNPKVSIVSSNSVQDYSFVLGVKQQYEMLLNTPAFIDGDYLDVHSAKDRRRYIFYFNVDASGNPPNAYTASDVETIEQVINVKSTDTLATLTKKAVDVINLYSNDLTAAYVLATVRLTITNVEEGIATGLEYSAGSGFTPTDIITGVGEDSSTNTVLISSLVSPAQAVDLTARSFVRMVNNNLNDDTYAYYISGVNDVPGKILLESRALNEDAFYITASSSITSESFSPTIAPEHSIVSITTGDETTNQIEITGHGYSDGDEVYITLTDITDPAIGINGLHTIQVVDANNIRLPLEITTVVTATGNVSSTSFSQTSENEDKDNRIYYSKYQQPESVPITNYFDVGAEDQSIIRIIPLRDSLFVFKLDGVYRVSGEVAPFNVQLFDGSTRLIAGDTADVVDNNVYCWTEQGIAMISESNVNIVSRVIDSDILKIGSSTFTNFSTATWGKGYESDNSYTVYTTKDKDDTTATIGYRYSTLTNTWTNVIKSPTCGVVNESDGKMYLGTSDTEYIEIERKDFERTDYADREDIDNIGNTKYNAGVVTVDDNSIYSVGDVVVQDQTLTIYQYNSLLAQLDTDTALVGGYETALTAIAGDNLRFKTIALAAQLDTDNLTDTDYESTIANQTFTISNISVDDPTIVTTTPHGLFTGRLVNISGSDSNPSIDGTHVVTVIDSTSFTIPLIVIGAGSTGTAESADENFEDVKACYNNIVDKINLDTVPDFSNYSTIDNNTLQETSILSVNTSPSNSFTLRDNLDFSTGNITIYHSIPSSLTYAPNVMEDPLGLKHLREAQIMFDNRALTSATIEFSTDILPAFQGVTFDLDGPGTFGSGDFGSGFFGGSSNSIPFRTYIPREKQYCTFMRVRYAHNTARESYLIYSTTLTGEVGLSSRTYR